VHPVLNSGRHRARHHGNVEVRLNASLLYHKLTESYNVLSEARLLTVSASVSRRRNADAARFLGRAAGVSGGWAAAQPGLLNGHQREFCSPDQF
jgi:hypothetical protein